MVLGYPFFTAGADTEKLPRDFLRGNDPGVLEQAREGLKSEPSSQDWSVLLARSLRADTGARAHLSKTKIGLWF